MLEQGDEIGKPISSIAGAGDDEQQGSNTRSACCSNIKRSDLNRRQAFSLADRAPSLLAGLNQRAVIYGIVNRL